MAAQIAIDIVGLVVLCVRKIVCVLDFSYVLLVVPWYMCVCVLYLFARIPHCMFTS